MLRLLLVFENIVFFKLGIDPSIIAFFVKLKIYGSAKIIFKIFWLYFTGNYIAPIGKNTGIRVFLFTFLFLKPFFKLFLSVFKDLYITEGIICKLKVWGLWLRLFDLKVFYSNMLDLYLSLGNVSRIIALLSFVVYFSDVNNKLEVFLASALITFSIISS